MGRRLDPDETPIAWFPDEGVYRIVRSKVEDRGDGVKVVVAEPGALVTWVDDAPSDPANGDGHWEQHHGSEEHYRASKPADEEG